MSEAESPVLSHRSGRMGMLTLNRPRALNALDTPMVAQIREVLEAWRDEPAVHAVVLRSATERAFCAGGDVRAVRAASLADDRDTVGAFFAGEYALNLAIATYPKPVVSLIDGLCLGGGVGLSVHGAVRVATEHAAVAMPETAIALFPDVGTSYVLPRMPGALGTYLALTGARMEGADAVHAGFATHFVPRADLPALRTSLEQDGVAVVATFAVPLPAFSLAAQRPVIDYCFAADSVVEIMARLETDGGDFARASLATLREKSPSSLAWSLDLLRAGARRTLAQALQAELEMTRWVTRHPDFIEGVRAMVVDKDRTPKWVAL
jgi:enoyl-CoA hydratase